MRAYRMRTETDFSPVLHCRDIFEFSAALLARYYTSLRSISATWSMKRELRQCLQSTTGTRLLINSESCIWESIGIIRKNLTFATALAVSMFSPFDFANVKVAKKVQGIGMSTTVHNLCISFALKHYAWIR